MLYHCPTQIPSVRNHHSFGHTVSEVLDYCVCVHVGSVTPSVLTGRHVHLGRSRRNWGWPLCLVKMILADYWTDCEGGGAKAGCGSRYLRGSTPGGYYKGGGGDKTKEGDSQFPQQQSRLPITELQQNDTLCVMHNDIEPNCREGRTKIRVLMSVLSVRVGPKDRTKIVQQNDVK